VKLASQRNKDNQNNQAKRRTNMNESALKALVDLRDRTIQKSRIAFGNRINAVDLERDTADEATMEIYRNWQERFSMMEKQLDEDIETLIEDMPIVESLVELKGIGKILAAKLISAIDIERADTVSALWRYAGYAVIDGEREKPTRGEKLHYNAELKKNLYLIATSFMRSGSPYREIYDTAKEYYLVIHPEWTKGHAHNASTRKMIKLFLSHLWEHWRTLEGLPIRDAYVLEHLGHNHKQSRFDFGWQRI
jgi:hypothetical protein